MQDNNIIQEAIDSLKRLCKENAELKAENARLKEIQKRLQDDLKRIYEMYFKESDKNYKLSEISLEYNARRCIENLYKDICDDTKSVQETYILMKDRVSEFLRIHKVMTLNYDEQKITYRQTLQEIKAIAENEIKKLTDSAVYGGRYLEILDLITKAESEIKNDVKEPKTYNGYLKDEMQNKYYKGR